MRRFLHSKANRRAAVFATLAALGLMAARADVASLVGDNQITWSSNASVKWVGDELVLTFDDTESAGSLTIGSTIKAVARILAVGGGGAGGTSTTTTNGGAGGGGGGGVLEISDYTLGAGTYTASVGAGGLAATSTASQPTPGGNGGDSIFKKQGDAEILRAKGGGGGGAASVGGDGGSGGGGSRGGTSNDKFAGGLGESGQGSNGGSGNFAKFGGGGGGATSAGANAGSQPGAGGAGFSSDISGSNVLYGNGGGGGRMTGSSARPGGGGNSDPHGTGGSISYDATAGEDGTGGGGGGGGPTNASVSGLGANGGSGIVIVRITDAFEVAINTPTGSDFVWDGDGHYGVEERVSYVLSGDVCATNVGNYVTYVTPAVAQGVTWADNGGTEARPVEWHITPKQIARPTVLAEADWPTYTGNVQTGIVHSADSAWYTVSGDATATNAGTHNFTVSLTDKANTQWADDQTTDDFPGTWRINPAFVEWPQAASGLVYNGAEQTALTATARYSFLSGSVLAATDAGEYSFTAHLIDSTNYRWNDGSPNGSADDHSGTWSIAQSPNEITSLTLDGWKVGSSAIPNTPDISATWGANLDTVEYRYAQSRDAAGSEWVAEPPNESGNWWLRAHIPETANWAAADGYVEFYLWDDPAEIFSASVKLTVSGYSGTALTNFPLVVRVSEQRLPGFTYDTAGDNGEGLAFLDEEENPLAYDVDTWDIKGESVLWVKVPVVTNGTQITMLWGVRTGQTGPGSNTQEVWSDYAGVWHFNETIASATAATTASADATGNKYDAMPRTANAQDGRGRMVSVEGAIGNGRQIETEIYTNGNRLSLTNSEEMALGDTFTFSGWINLKGAPSGRAEADLNYLASRKTGRTSAGGWCAIINRSSYSDKELKEYIVYGGNGTGLTARGSAASVALTAAGWSYFSFMYSGTALTTYCANSSGGWTATGTVGAPTDNGQPIAFGQSSSGASGYKSLWGQVDEYRLRRGAVSEDWAKAEYANATADDFLMFDLVETDEGKVNYWASEPTVSPTSWDVGETPSFVFDAGALADGAEVVYTIVSLYTGETFDSLSDITEAGAYQVVFSMADGTGYVPITYVVDIYVRGPQSYGNAGGTSGETGRVLLMNRDANTSGKIDYQGHSDTRDTLATFWQFIKTETDGLPRTWNLQNDTESILWTKNNGARLWHLVDCRHGNTFKSDDTTTGTDNLEASQNYLPYSTATSYSFTSRLTPARQNKMAGQVVMRNSTNACVYSTCFAEGIGTIYFDAVNGWTDETGDNYKIVVEIATNLLEVAEGGEATPFDENIVPLVDEDGVTNLYGYVDWQPVPARLYNTQAGAYGEAALTNALAISAGGTMQNFYRAVVPLDIRVPVRFRIRRVSRVEGKGIDATGFILLDNIIASYPAMKADLKSPGWHDEDENGLEAKRAKRALGWECAFSEPFPAAGASGVIGRALAEFSTNAAMEVTAAAATNFVAAAELHYRWRYLDQRFGPEQTVSLNPRNDFRASKALTLPAFACDVEYWYTAVLQAPYYKYVDYSGTSIGTPGYSEEVSAVTNRASDAAGGRTYESRGTDWYVRLREGASRYEAVRMHARSADGLTTYEPVDFDLTGNHVWRGYLKTGSAVEGGVNFRFEGLNPQEGGWAAFNTETNHWKSSYDIRTLPASTMLTDGGEDEWANVPCDAATGYLMFQLDDTTHSLTVTHADYQNFNKWHDAHKADGKFYGTSTEDEKKSGTSPQTRDYSNDFSTWVDTPMTESNLWCEAFAKVDAGRGYGNYRPYEPWNESMTTPNGWRSGPGMWSNTKYLTGTDMGLQMKGQGAGYVQYVAPEGEAPRGLGSVTFRARLAQEINFNTMSFSFADGTMNKSNYTFFAHASLRSSTAADGYDGDGTVSLLAYYRPMKGCYEFRVARNASTTLLLSVYRWTRGEGAAITGTLLSEQTFQNVYTAMHKGGTMLAPTYGGMFISCKNTDDGTEIVAGIQNALRSRSAADVDISADFVGLKCVDGDAKRLSAGSFGLTCKSCPAEIWNPRHWDEPVNSPSTAGNTSGGTLPAAKRQYFNKSTLKLGTGAISDAATMRNDLWAIDDSRLVHIDDGDTDPNFYGLAATNTPQRVAIQWAPAGTEKWTTLKEVVVDSYTMSNPYETFVYLKDNASARLKMLGTEDDPRTDVLIDDVRLNQWRGDDLGGRDSVLYPFSDGDSGSGWPTNFYYSSCWLTNHTVKMSARRTLTNDVCSLRMPLMDGNGSPRRGIGLGMVSFEYVNAQTNVNLLLQVATNGVSDSVRLINKSTDPLVWTTVTNFSFAGATDLAHGVRSHYLGMHGVKGVMRLVMDPALVNKVHSTTDTTAFGEIDIEKIFCRDEPDLDTTCWWGWNLRTINNDGSSRFDDGSRSYLPDLTFSAFDTGLSLGLNNSTSADTVEGKAADYEEHMPFVQTPTFTSNIVGEVTFRARKFDLSGSSQAAEVTLYGATTGNVTHDASWTALAHFLITNTTYETYSYQSKSEVYRAFRLGVTGVEGVKGESRGPAPTAGANPVRVMLDEIAVYEAVRPTMGFRYVYPFRTELDATTAHTNVVRVAGGGLEAVCDEQPLLQESWTVQAEIERRQLPDEIDMTTPGHEPKVIFHWYAGLHPWGFVNWATNAAAGHAELALADGEKMVFRGSIPKTPSAVVQPIEAGPAVVQYSAQVVYWNVNGSEQTNSLLRSEWDCPEWYRPIDYNDEFSSTEAFSAFTILDSISPKRVWFNEVNVYDGETEHFEYPAKTNQYIEIAVPRRQPIDGWYLDYIDSNMQTNTLCTFGLDAVSTKTMHETNDYVFVTLQSPTTMEAGSLSAEAGEVDGVWNDFDGYGGELTQDFPIALRLTRPSGVVEQEIVLEGTNMWAESRYAERFSATNYLAQLSAATKGGKFLLAGNEWNTPSGNSLGVTNGTGAAETDWTNLMEKTPGRANTGQLVPFGYVIYANGSMLTVRARIGADGSPHVRQTFGEAVDTLAEVLAMTLRGDAGTNIVYHIDDWWEIKSVTTNGVPVAEAAGATGEFSFAAGAGQSNDVVVVATAQPREDLRTTFGLDDDNRYRDAVMDWLAKGSTARGPFAGTELTEDAWFKGLYSPDAITNLTLTQRYWLDIDPTEPGWVFRAGVLSAPDPVQAAVFVPGGGGEEPHYETVDNMLITVKMFITNETDDVTSPNYGAAHSPYMLRGLEPGSRSDDPVQAAAWTSVTFKVTGDIQNNKPMRKRWVPLRRFVFDGNSFDADHTSTLEIWDPFDDGSIWTPGWGAYRGCPVFYRWDIDDRGGPDTIDTLTPMSVFQ